VFESNTAPTAELPILSVVASAWTTTCSVYAPGLRMSVIFPRAAASIWIPLMTSVLNPPRTADSV
jgi:hypothetical protein